MVFPYLCLYARVLSVSSVSLSLCVDFRSLSVCLSPLSLCLLCVSLSLPFRVSLRVSISCSASEVLFVFWSCLELFNERRSSVSFGHADSISWVSQQQPVCCCCSQADRSLYLPLLLLFLWLLALFLLSIRHRHSGNPKP